MACSLQDAQLVSISVSVVPLSVSQDCSNCAR